MNLSVDIEKNTSLTYCVKKFSTKELLNLGDKFFCEACNTKQVATRQMMIKHRPKLLLIHLKRFKMDFKTMQHLKLTYRIPYPQVLHIEDSLIYHAEEKTEIQEEEKEKQKVDDDLQINNKAIFSEAHMGQRKLVDLVNEQDGP